MLIASDSFKGSLDTIQAAEGIKEGIMRVFPEAIVEFIPIADGGEGTVEVLVTSLGGELKYKEVTKPNGGKIRAKYGVLDNGNAVIEMAAASGLTLVTSQEMNIMEATTYGTGELIKAALDEGCQKILIGIGGSATNDGGVGMAQALGVSFKDKNGQEVGLGGKVLTDIEEIDLSGLDERIHNTEIDVMCDVTNFLYGTEGAARVYGPQKGATEEQIVVLDKGLEHLADVLEKLLHRELRWEKGSGAAGGLGMGMVGFLGANLKSGIEAIMSATDIDKKMQRANIVITGEGKIDNQSVRGKVIDGIANKAKEHGKPVIAIVGSAEENLEEVYAAGINTLEAAVCRPVTIEYAMSEAARLVADAAERVMRAIDVGINLAQSSKDNKEEGKGGI